tara:strand:- start:7923 stop:8792 length:870 start_codon:yes stop_codon:yes gene_type:complete
MATATFTTPTRTIALAEGTAVAPSHHLAASGLTDWYAGAQAKSPINERPQAPGAFNTGTDWSSSLAISIRGFYNGTSNADALLAAENLSALAGGASVDVAVTDAVRTTSRHVSVRRVSIPDFGVRSAFEFTVDMVAVDPLRYGPEIVASTGVPVSGGGLLWPLGAEPTEFWDWGADGSSGRLSLTNDGTAAVWPSLTVEGGLGGGFVATNVTTGESIRFVRPIPAGSSVTINQRTGMASIDGQSDVSGFITERGFFSVPAKETHQIQFAALGAVTGTPQFTATLSPGYL